VKKFGNVTLDTEFTFEYKMKKVKQLLKIAEFDFSVLKQLPFQA